MVFSLRAAVPLPDVRAGLSSKESTSRASVRVKVACEKLSRKSRKLSRKRRRFRRNFNRRNKEVKDMSPVADGPFDSYWQNYYRCLKWTQNHHVSYWKSRVQALEYENRMLRSLVDRNMKTDISIPLPLHNSYCPKYFSGNRESDSTNYVFDSSSNNYQEKNANEDGCDEDTEEFEFEVDNNMIEFFTQSMKHKLALKQERGKSEDTQEFESKYYNGKKNRKWSQGNPQEKQFSKEERLHGEPFSGKKRMPYSHNVVEHHIDGTELEEILQKKADQEEKEKQKIDLYGKGAPKIMGMETAMQLSFYQICSSKHPTTWPVIPLNL